MDLKEKGLGFQIKLGRFDLMIKFKQEKDRMLLSYPSIRRTQWVRQ
jgi:hypothetical protein